MDAKSVIKDSLVMADMVALGYLNDMSDADLMQRPHPACNHVNWQIGHLILSEHQMMNTITGGKMPPLPEGFQQKYERDAVGVDDGAFFLSKEQLLATHQQQRSGTLGYLASLSEDQLDSPSGIDYAPTVGAVLALHGAHWLMHCGQWVVVRRICDKPIVM